MKECEDEYKREKETLLQTVFKDYKKPYKAINKSTAKNNIAEQIFKYDSVKL